MALRQKIKVQFVDFWHGFNHQVNYVADALRDVYEIEWVDRNPDLLVYSVFGDEHKNIEAKTKLIISHENSFPDFAECDYAISTVQVNVPGRTLYFPAALNHLFFPIEIGEALGDNVCNRKFCCFIYSQDRAGLGASVRKCFAQKLMEYKFVECPGKVLHNTDSPELSARLDSDWSRSKIDYMRQFKFVVAFENTDNVGYITEKLIHAYASNTVPIYWGSTADVSPFPKESMICAADYPTLDALVNRVKEVDNDPEQYIAILKANPLRDADFVRSLQEMYSKREIFIRKVAESALRQKPEFQSRCSSSLWNSDLRPVERKLYSEIVPKAYSISVDGDVAPRIGEREIPEEDRSVRIEKLEAGFAQLVSILEGMNAVGAATNERINNLIAPEIQCDKLRVAIIRLSRKSFVLHIKKLFSTGARRTRVKEAISDVGSRLSECRTLYKELKNKQSYR